MATSNLTELEKSECKIFLQTLKDSSSIKISTDNNKEFFSFDNHFESFCFCMTHDEIPGELIDIANRYLHFKYDSVFDIYILIFKKSYSNNIIR